MARNNYFKVSSRESGLLEDLVIEQIKIYGFDVHYIFRKFQNLDDLFGEDPVSKFDKSFQIEMFVSNYEFFETQNKIMDKFGISLQDSVTLMVSKRRFSEECAKYGTDTKPQEGDLIYFPEYGGLYEIKYIGSRNSYFAYEISCELFRYSGEKIDTEIKEVDDIETNLVLDIRRIELAIEGGTGSFFEGEKVYQGSGLSAASWYATIANYDKLTNTIEVHSETGTPSSLVPLRGEKSLAYYFYDSVETTEKKFLDSRGDDTENMEQERAKTDIIDFTDKDPFSEGNY
jgi:hypothetical protein